ncbi:hypothetical protein DYU05_11170 [Mucilaginibacter terrenus]|uniref:Uncharacterized protein n=1 Tax=Mucilaginibacter terrenus TaxID=2482727 RepID=A0A3E2NP10_9SPHI|nr:hypothetical protein [Mucilaginibacter terrenus]RFZ82728.1 hypothetical protein DYU05_11170 [Mucilaginibacter terrenus]
MAVCFKGLYKAHAEVNLWFKLFSHGYKGEDQNGRNIFFGGQPPRVAPAILTNAYNRFDLIVLDLGYRDCALTALRSFCKIFSNSLSKLAISVLVVICSVFIVVNI